VSNTTYWELLNANGNYKIGLLWPFSPVNGSFPPQERLKNAIWRFKNFKLLRRMFKLIKKLREMQTKYIMGDHLCTLLLLS
jgi:hypothetical protein